MKHKSVLYIQLEGIGNMVLALPAIEAIRSAGYDVSVCGKLPALDLVPADIKAYTVDEIAACEHFDVILFSPWSAEYIEKYGKGARKP